MRLMMCAVAGLALAGPALGQLTTSGAEQEIGEVIVYQPAQGVGQSRGGSNPLLLNWTGSLTASQQGRPGPDAPTTTIRSYMQQQQRQAQALEIDEKPVTLRTTGASLQVYLGDEPYPESRMKGEDKRTVLLDSDGKPAGEMVVTGQRVELRPIQDEQQGRLLIGVSLSPVDSTLAKHLNVEPDKASVISSVTEGWPASKAGLEGGDIIVAVEGKDEGTSEAIRAVIAERGAGDAIKLRVISGGEQKDVTVTLSDDARASTAMGIGSMNLPSEYLSAVQLAPQGVTSRTVTDLNLMTQAGQYRGQLQRAEELRTARIQELRAAESRMRQPDQAGARGQGAAEAVEAQVRALREQSSAQRELHEFAVATTDGGARVTVDIPSGGSSRRAVIATRPESDISRRLGAIEERMARIEKLLEKLTEQAGAR